MAGWSYDDDNSHIAAVTQSQVQDVFWLHEASVAIKEHLPPAYFVKKPSAFGQTRRYYAIIRLTFDFKGRYDAAWRRLVSGNSLKLSLLHDPTEDPEDWSAMILDHPESVSALSEHPVDLDDLVLLVAHPGWSTILPRQFETRFDANAAFEKDNDE